MESEITVRQAMCTMQDASLIARCVMMGVGYELDTLTDDKKADVDELERLCMRNDTLYSYRNAFIAERDGEPLGAMVAYDGQEYHGMRARSFPYLSFFKGQDLETLQLETRAGEFYFDTLAVMPAFRRQGVARTLFCHVIGYMRAHHPRLRGVLLVDPDNPHALSLYSSLGFRHKGEVFAFGMLYWRMELQ